MFITDVCTRLFVLESRKLKIFKCVVLSRKQYVIETQTMEVACNNDDNYLHIFIPP